MKKNFLLRVTAIAAFVFTAMSAFAQNWTPPVEPSDEYPALESTEPVNGGAYYVRNVESGQFLTAGSAWATRIMTSTDMTPYMQIVVEDVTGEDAYEGCVKMRLNGTFRFTSAPGSPNARTDYEVTNTYLFREYDGIETPATGQVDRGGQACWYWKFTPAEDGAYYIQNAPGMNNFNVNGDEYFYAPSPGADVLMNGPIDSPGVTWKFIAIDSFDKDAFIASVADRNEAMKAYQARVTLYDLLNEADEYGADTSEAGALYNNPDATSEDLEAAIEPLRASVRTAFLAWAAQNSTADSPIELNKYALVNPDFETGNATGWSVTETMAVNRGFQNNLQYYNPEEELLLKNFIEAWRSSAEGVLGNGFIYQTITGLPAGHYVLECDALSFNQISEESESYIDPADYVGVHLYYTDGEIVVPSDEVIKGTVGYNDEGNRLWQPLHFSFGFDIEETEFINVGIMVQNTNVNWVAADNFALYAAGPSQTPPSYTALRAEYSTSSQLLDSDYPAAQKSLEEALKQAVENARSLVEAVPDASKVEAYTAAFTAMNNARAELQTSIAAYNKLLTFLDQLDADQQAYKDKANCGPIADKISALSEELQGKYDEGSISADEINETINGYNDFIKQAIQARFDELVAEEKALDEPFDITVLFPTMEFAYGTTQTAYANGYPAENPVWMNATNTGNFKINYSTAEVWNARPFDIYREFLNMPIGKYTIETHGFVRVADRQDNYDRYMNGDFSEGGYSYLYAGNTHTDFVNTAELTYTEGGGGLAEINLPDGSKIYGIQTQDGFYNLLNDTNNPEYIEKTRTTASTVITEEGGTLRVGVIGTDMLEDNQWTLWSGFRLYYSGIDDSIIIDGLNDELQSLIADATVLTFFTYVTESTNLLDASIAQGNEALEKTDAQSKKDAVAALKNAINTANETQRLIEELFTLYEDYVNKFPSLDGDEYTYVAFEDLWDEISDAVSTEGLGVESNAKLQEMIDELPTSFVKYVLSDTRLDNATVDEPFDVTSLITNWDFSTATTANRVAPRGWTIELENPDKGNVESNSGGYEIWRNTGAARLSQALPTLREGYWRLTVDGFFRTGTVASTQDRYNEGTLDVYAYLFLNDLTKKLYSAITEGMYTFDNSLGGKTYNLDDVGTVYIPDQGGSCQNYFNAGYYTANTIDFKYTDGPVEFGVFKNADTTLPEDWIYIDNFHLYYLGTTAPTAVESLTAEEGQVPAAAIYSIDGRRQSRLQRGINIVRRADGTVTKILVK